MENIFDDEIQEEELAALEQEIANEEDQEINIEELSKELCQAGVKSIDFSDVTV